MKRDVVILICCAILAGCTKPGHVPDCSTPPMELALKIVDSSGNDLLAPAATGSYADSIRLDASDNHNDSIHSFIYQYTNAEHKISYILDCPGIGYYSANNGIKLFYLRRSHQITDTLYADYYYQNNNTHCSGNIRFREFRFNGKPVVKITDSPGWYFQAIETNKSK